MINQPHASFWLFNDAAARARRLVEPGRWQRAQSQQGEKWERGWEGARPPNGLKGRAAPCAGEPPAGLLPHPPPSPFPPADEGLWDILIKDIPKEVTSYTFSMDILKQGVSYDFRVIAVNDYGYGTPSTPSPSVSGSWGGVLGGCHLLLPSPPKQLPRTDPAPTKSLGVSPSVPLCPPPSPL